MQMQQQTSQETELVMGARVRYHGSVVACHGDDWVVLPSRDQRTWCEEDIEEQGVRYRLVAADPDDERVVELVRRTSFEVLPHRWPAGAVPLTLRGHLYMADYTTPPLEFPECTSYRTVWHFMAIDLMGRTSCEITPANAELIATLDARAPL